MSLRGCHLVQQARNSPQILRSFHDLTPTGIAGSGSVMPAHAFVHMLQSTLGGGFDL